MTYSIILKLLTVLELPCIFFTEMDILKNLCLAHIGDIFRNIYLQMPANCVYTVFLVPI